MVTQITIDSIVVIGQQILNSGQKCSSIDHLIKGERKDQKINDDYNKIIFYNVSSDIKTVVIDCMHDTIESITVYGTLNVTPRQLYLKYNNFRETYSVHDDLYFYFFNYDKNDAKYSISFFEPNHRKINVEQDNERLYNIQINW